MKCELWTANCEVWTENCEAWTMTYFVFLHLYLTILEILEVWTVKYELWSWTMMSPPVFRRHISHCKICYCSETCILCSPPPQTEVGVIWLLVRIPLASCLHSISWTNGWILTHYWGRGKKWLDFGDLDLIFKVTPALWNFQIVTKKACLQWGQGHTSTLNYPVLTQKSLSAPYLLKQMTDSGQTSCIVLVMLGFF